MNGKKAKLIRRIARGIAIENTILAETQYDASYNSKKQAGGTFVTSHCERAIINQLKQVAGLARNIPARLFTQIAERAIISE